MESDYFETQVEDLGAALRAAGVEATRVDYGYDLERAVETPHGAFSIKLSFSPSNTLDELWLAGFTTPTIGELGEIGFLCEDLMELDEVYDADVDSTDGRAALVAAWFVEMDAADSADVRVWLESWFADIAEAHYAAGGTFVPESDSSARTEGFAAVHTLGELYSNQDHNNPPYLEIEALAKGAEEAFFMAGLDWHAFTTRVARADLLHLDGRLNQALKLLDSAAAELDAERHPDVLAACFYQQSITERAMYNDDAADRLLRKAVAVAQELGLQQAEEWQENLSILDSAKRNPANSVRLLRGQLKSASTDDFQDWMNRTLNLAQVLVTSGQENEGLGLLRNALREAERSAEPMVGMISATLAASLVEANRPREANEVLDEYVHLVTDPASLQLVRLVRSASGNSTTIIGGESGPYDIVNQVRMLIDQGRFREAVSAGRSAIELFDERNEVVTATRARANLALALLGESVADSGYVTPAASTKATDLLVEGLKRLDGMRHSFSTAAERQAWTEKAFLVYELALGVSVEARNFALCLELIETLKAQGLPDYVARSSATASSPSWSDGVRAPDRRSVGGHSFLATSDDRLAALESIASHQGGPHTWWWTVWVGFTASFWATLSPEGVADAGLIQDSVFVSEADAMAAFEMVAAGEFQRPDGRPQSRFTSRIDSLHRELLAACSEQEPLDRGQRFDSVCRELGSLIVPPPVLRALRDASETNPLSLVFSPSAALSWVPPGIVSVQGHDGCDFRVLERALVQVAFPYIGDLHPPDPVRQRTVGSLTVVDPSDNLPNAEHLIDGSELMLSGRIISQRRPSTPLATRSHLLSVLRQEGTAAITVLLYAGHTRPPTADSPLSMGLVCTREAGHADVLTVRDLVAEAADFHIPRHVILCACSSARDTDSDYAERWGVSVGFGLAGARSIIGSTWDLRADKPVMQFAAGLRADLARPGIDPVATLRHHQLIQLKLWRQAVTTNGELVSSEALPHYWAAWVVSVASLN